MPEYNIVDENDNIIGKDTRENIHINGLLHREVHVWIFNKNEQVLFQRRAKTKDTFPDLLDASAGGHVEIADDYKTAAIRELEEETGIKAEINDLIFLAKLRRNSFDKKTGMKNNIILNIYAYQFNGEVCDLKLENGLAASLEFWKIDKILNLDEKEKEEFIWATIDTEYIEIFRIIKNLNIKN